MTKLLQKINVISKYIKYNLEVIKIILYFKNIIIEKYTNINVVKLSNYCTAMKNKMHFIKQDKYELYCNVVLCTH
jgi:hypothetical protein